MFISNQEHTEIKNIIKKSGIKTKSNNSEYVLFKLIQKLLTEVDILKKKIKDLEE